MTRTCSQCGGTKPLQEFNRDKRGKDGHRADCKACTKLRNRRLYVKDRERRLAVQSAYHKANRERLLAEMKAYDAANRERFQPRKRAWREANRERMAELTRQWRRDNPDRARALQQAKKARKRQAPYEVISPAEIYERDTGVCGICGEATDPNDWHLDHIIPLSRGGHHLHGNVQVSHPACNMRKAASLPDELPALAA